MTWTRDPTLVRIAKSAFAVLVALVCYWTAAAAPARLFDRTAARPTPWSSSFRRGCLEALVVARLETPNDIPDRRANETLAKSIQHYRRLGATRQLPVGSIASLDGVAWSTGVLFAVPDGPSYQDSAGYLRAFDAAARPVARGFRWTLDSRVSPERKRRVRERLEALIPDRRLLGSLKESLVPSGWTRIEYTANAPPGSTRWVTPLVAGHVLTWRGDYDLEVLSIDATPAARVPRAVGAYLPLQLPAEVWWEAGTGRLVLRSQEDGKWLVVHVPSCTILLEAE